MWRELNQRELKQLYESRMVHDFPAEELKPLSRLMRMQADGDYFVLAWEVQGVLQAYACIYMGRRPALLDYFAVAPQWRGQGIGSRALSAWLSGPGAEAALLVELEAPEAANNSADQAVRLSRMRFYERLGFSDSGVRAVIFGVKYGVFQGSAHLASAEVASVLAEIYRYFVADPARYGEQVLISLKP